MFFGGILGEGTLTLAGVSLPFLKDAFRPVDLALKKQKKGKKSGEAEIWQNY